MTPLSPQTPRPHLLIRCLNAPFTLWLLSAIVLTVGGAYFSGHQKCEADTEKIITNYYKLQIELMERLEHIQAGVASAKSLQDINDTLQTQPNVYIELKERTTRDMIYELRRTEGVIDYSRAKSFIDDLTPRFPSIISPSDVVRYGSIPVGQKPTDMTPDDLQPAKRFVEADLGYQIEKLRVYNQISLWTKCDFINSFLGATARGPRKVIEVARKK
jgi:hypothetical protein